MRKIEFNTNKLIDQKRTTDKPVVNIVRVNFSSNISEWFPQLSSASLRLSTICYDDKEIELGSYSSIVDIGSYIDLYQKQPLVEINHIEHFLLEGINLQKKSFYITRIELIGVELNNTDSISVYVIDREYIETRVKDWLDRIESVYDNIETWISDYPIYSHHWGSPIYMQEEMMRTFEVPTREISTLDILRNNKIVLSLKPKGLWIIGANGRIDILSSKGSFMIVDIAERFQQPNWTIYTPDKKTSASFEKKTFLEILTTV